MNTKEYLSQVERYNMQINNNIAEISRLRLLATSISVATDKENISASGNKDKLGGIVAKIVDLEHETNELIDDYINKRNHIIEQINAMKNNKYYDVLTLRFVNGFKINQIADELLYSEDSIKRIQREAMNVFEKMFGQEYLKKS